MAKKRTVRKKAATNAKKSSGRSGKGSTVTPARRICNIIPPVGTENDWTYEDAIGGGALGAVAALPASVDLRESPWWTIEDQEDTGSCVGWAAAEGVVQRHSAW